MDILQAIQQRASTRAYLNKPVDRAVIEQILAAARRAPSGVNHQPWHVAVVRGQSKQKLSAAIIAARHAGLTEQPDYEYYAKQWVEPYKTRRKACGIAMYQALNIQRDDTARRQLVWENNYHFFHAPVGLIFYIDQHLARGSWMDMGMFMQNIMLAALQFELATCPQAALAEYPQIIRQQLQINEQFHIA